MFHTQYVNKILNTIYNVHLVLQLIKATNKADDPTAAKFVPDL